LAERALAVVYLSQNIVALCVFFQELELHVVGPWLKINI